MASNMMVDLARHVNAAIGMTILKKTCLMCKRNGVRLFLRSGKVVEYELCAYHAFVGVNAVNKPASVKLNHLVDRDISPWTTFKTGGESINTNLENALSGLQRELTESRDDSEAWEERAREWEDVAELRGKKIAELRADIERGMDATSKARIDSLQQAVDRLVAEKEEAKPVGPGEVG